MKKTLLYILLTTILGGNSNSQSILPLFNNWDDNSLPAFVYGAYNDCWGYVDPNGREYAILGAMNGTFFFDVTDPANPVVVSYQPGNDSNAIHRDYKTYQHYAYGVADEGNSTLQIWDLQYLPDSVVKVYDSNQLSLRCHNIFISDDKLFLAANTIVGGFHAMDVLSLANPTNPTFLSTLINPAFWHVHDVYVKNDTAYCSAGNDGFYIYNYLNPVNPVLIQSITSYPEQGYNHSSWVSEDGNILVFADENWGKGLKLYDISDISNPQLLSVFRSNLLNIQPPNTQFGSIAHNPFIINNKVVISYYHDGVQVFDITDPSNPVQTHYYDTYPQNIDYDNFKGCWGVYPYLPSGTIIASDIENGLFLLDGSGVILGYSNPLNSSDIKIFPNPFQENFKVQLASNFQGEILTSLKDVTGRIVKEEKKYNGSGSEIFIDSSGLIPGVYILSIRSNDFLSSVKLIKSQ